MVTAVITLPIKISNGAATATTPRITAITVLTGAGRLEKAVATVLTTFAIPLITGVKALPSSIAAFFMLFMATCIL